MPDASSENISCQARKTGQRGTGQRLRTNQGALMSWAECLLNVTLVAFVIYAAIRFLLLWIFPPR
jgi:hypothetical protein